VSETPRPLPGFATWPTFPFEGDFHVKKLDDPVPVEPTRHGEDPSECRACRAPDEAYVWVSERWRVRSLDRPTGLPMVLILESRSHLDLGDLPNMLAAELGVMTVRIERAVRSLDGVARVHVNRWGDGSAHLHLWFLARPYGRLQLRGTFLSLWDEILPPIDEHQWRENLALVAAWLAEFGGRPLAEPPRIDWKAPAMFAVAEAPATDADENADEDRADESGADDLDPGAGTVGGMDGGAKDSGAKDGGGKDAGGKRAPGADGVIGVEAHAANGGRIVEGLDDAASDREPPAQRDGSAADRDSAAATPA
jgi:hypothetical protein